MENYLTWWNLLSFEQKFFRTIKWLIINGRDTTERHPHHLTEFEIKEIYETLETKKES